MKIKKLSEMNEIEAGDGTRLRELIHPRNDSLDLKYSLAHARLKSGLSSKKHRLKNSEVYYILSGIGKISIEKQSRIIKSGEIVYIPPRATQSIKNIGQDDLEFLCIVDPAWRNEDEEIL